MSLRTLRVVVLALGLTAALYAARPEHKTVTYTVTVEGESYCSGSSDPVCEEGQWLRAPNRRETRKRRERTNAWERISGAISG